MNTIRQFRPVQKSALRKRIEETCGVMPRLRHKTTDPFDITQSEVARWLCSQPGIMQTVFNTAVGSGTIVFDQSTGLWEGSRND